MKYNSTRGQVTDQSFEQALFSGYAGDGGILLPEVIPKIDRKTLQKWSELDFTGLAKEILALYIPDTEIPRCELSGTCFHYNKFECSSKPD